MAQNIIPFPMHRVKAAPIAVGIRRPLWDAKAIAKSKERYEMCLREGHGPQSLRMTILRECIRKCEADWAEYEASCRAANGGNVLEMRRA